MKTYTAPKMITLYRGALLWIARDTATGQDIGPTPFESSTPAAEVLAALRPLNPGSAIVAEEDARPIFPPSVLRRFHNRHED